MRPNFNPGVWMKRRLYDAWPNNPPPDTLGMQRAGPFLGWGRPAARESWYTSASHDLGWRDAAVAALVRAKDPAAEHLTDSASGTRRGWGVG